MLQEDPDGNITIPTGTCSRCGQIVYIALDGPPDDDEYEKKLRSHASLCHGDGSAEIAVHFRVIRGDVGFGLNIGDLLACRPCEYDKERVTVCLRLSDDHDPRCTVGLDQVQLVLGTTLVRERQQPPYGYYRLLPRA